MAVSLPKKNRKQPKACTSAFGRIFFGVDSTLYYSQVILNPSDAGRCYQRNDPTSEDIPDLLDTDGGEIEIKDCQNIQAIKAFRNGVLVFASNGLWYVSNPDGGFTATAYNIEKISERGVSSVRSIVEANGAMFYFSNNGIMSVNSNEFNVLQATDITENTIRSHYLRFFSGKKSEGVFKDSLQQIEWWNPEANGRGLVLDLSLGAFYPQQQASTTTVLKSPFTIYNKVYYPSYTLTSFSYNFSLPQNTTFKDFGVDQEAFLITGEETLGKFANKKSIAQAKVYFRKTETQITSYTDGAYVFDKPSSCLFQARWDFDNSDAFGKYTGVLSGSGKGKAMQLYKPLQRGFIPDAYPYTFDTGEKLISKKFNIRGNGDSVRFVFQTEPEKDLQLLGYSVSYTMRGKV